MTQLPPEEGKLFYELYPALMSFANERLKVVSDTVVSPEEYIALPPETRIKVRDALHARPDLIDEFVAENPEGFTADGLEIVASWKQAVVGKFYIFRYLKHYTVFLTSGKEPMKAYGVLALADPLEELVGPYLPILTNAVLLPFKGKIIYDGLLSSYRISFGGGMKRMLNEEYKQAKAQFGIVTSLTDEGRPAPQPTKKAKAKKRRGKESRKIRSRLEEVMSLLPCPASGCWGLHGAETAYYFDRGCECHVLEVWPVRIDEPDDHSGNGHKMDHPDILYELAEFEFTDLIKEVPLEHFHFSQRRAVFEIGWKEGGQDLELRVHIEPQEVDEN